MRDCYRCVGRSNSTNHVNEVALACLEHSIIGGLGEIVVAVLARELGLRVKGWTRAEGGQARSNVQEGLPLAKAI
jgi:transketolase C-terminal domain/subunit